MKAYKLLFPLAALALLATSLRAQDEILNASYDVARELFVDVNAAFVPYHQKATGKSVSVKQSHAGSSRQARSVVEGLKADVVTLNQVNDVQLLVQNGFVGKDWTSRYAYNSSPYYSIHSILVRKGNPKAIRDWADLAKPGVTIVQVNPKTGGNGRYAVLAYYAGALEATGGNATEARAMVKKILANVVVFEGGGRAATATFTERGIGDALVTFEAETLELAHKPGGEFEAVTPQVSVLSEFPVAVVDKVAKKRNTTELARAYLEFLYTPEGQEIIAKNSYRPRNEEVAKRHADKLAQVRILEVDKAFGGWDKVTKEFFDNGALVDKLLAEIAAERK